MGELLSKPSDLDGQLQVPDRRELDGLLSVVLVRLMASRMVKVGRMLVVAVASSDVLVLIIVLKDPSAGRRYAWRRL